MSKTIEYILKLKDQFTSGIAKAKAEAGGLDQQMGKITSSLGGMAKAAGLAFVAFEGFSFIKDGVEAAEKLHKAEAQVNAALMSTHQAAGLSREALEENSKALSKNTLFSRSSITEMQSLLLTFTGIKGAIFKDAEPAIMDLATRMGGDGPADLKGASIQVGKALEDPIKGIAALHRVGVSFSESQKAMIKHLVETNQKAKAQTLILEELKKEFGGSAEAAANTEPFFRFNKIMGNIKITIGELIISIQKKLAPVLEWLGTAFKNILDWMKGHPQLLKAIAIGIGVVAGAFVLWTAATWALNAALNANPLLLIAVGIAALIAGIVYAYNRFKLFRDIVSEVWSVIKYLASTIWDFISAIAEAIKKTGLLQEAWMEIKVIFQTVGDVLSWLYNHTLKPIFDGIKYIADWMSATRMGLTVDNYRKLLGASQNKIDAKNKSDESREANGHSIEDMESSPDEQPGMSGMPTGEGMGGGGETTGADKVTGTKNTTINITIGSLVKELKLQTTTLNQSAQEIQKMITQVLLTAVNDAQIMSAP